MSRYKPNMGLKTAQIDKIFTGSVDMHVHVAPDPEWDRRLDTLDTAEFAASLGMKGFVAKSFFYPTTTEARIVNKVLQDTGVTAYGSITIGYSTTGDVDNAAAAVLSHAKLGCKVIWFPAFDAAYCRKGYGREGGINILEADGSLKQGAKDVLAIAKEYDMVVCKGHMSFPETKALFKEASQMGITKLVITHPLADTWGFFSMDEIKELISLGAVAELVYGSTLHRLQAMDPSDMVDFVHEVGAENVIMSTDLAQCMDVNPAEGMRNFVGTLLQFGCTDEEVTTMCKTNPYRLLDIVPEQNA